MVTVIEFIQGDITQVAADAIVNAANSRLEPGSGVCGAILKAGGASIFEECRRIGGCPAGSAVATGAGSLPAKYVFHAVGPVYHGKEKDVEQLASCHLRCLDLALEKGCRGVAFPAISTGVYGYPPVLAAGVALRSIRDHASPPVELVRLVCFSDESLRVLEAARVELGLP